MISWAFDSHADGQYDLGSQLLAHTRRRTEQYLAASHARNDALTTAQEIADRQVEVRAAVLAGMGGLPDAAPGPPPYEEVGRLERDGFVVHKLIIEAAPGVLIPALLSVPTGLTEPAGAVLFSCGHAVEGKAAPLYQAACARFARNGLVTLVLDPIGQGERWSYLNPDGSMRVRCNTYEHSYAGVQSWWLGESITRWFVRDARRGIDLLAALPEVDPTRIAAVGNSGGGTLTTWLMALEPRLAAAVPSCFVSDRLAILRTGIAQDGEQHMLGDPTAAIDHEDLLLTMAPRPVLVCSANYDFFPVDGTVSTVARVRRAYELLGAGDRLQHARADHRHGFSPELALAATRFLVGQFMPGREVDPTEVPPLAPTEVQCTPSGQVLLDRPTSRTVFDLNLERFEQLEPVPERESDAWLAERVHGPRQLPAELFPRWQEPVTDGAVSVRRGYWSSEVDLISCGVLITPVDGPVAELEVVLLEHGTADIDTHRDELIAAATRGTASLVIDVRGVGAAEPHAVNNRPHLDQDYGTLFLVLTELLWQGDSLVAGRVFDVLRAVELARTDPAIGLAGAPVRLRGQGSGAFVARTAARLDPALGEPRVTEEAIVPELIMTTRYHGEDRSWLSVLPGAATRLP